MPDRCRPSLFASRAMPHSNSTLTSTAMFVYIILGLCAAIWWYATFIHCRKLRVPGWLLQAMMYFIVLFWPILLIWLLLKVLQRGR